MTRGGAGSVGKQADFTRSLIPRVEDVLGSFGFSVYGQKAADVKPWATDKRLKKAFPNVKASFNGKSRDAFDAGRHALYAATKYGGMDDPLR